MASFHVILISDEHVLIQGVRDRCAHAGKVTVMHRIRRRLPPASLNDGPVLILVELLHASASALAKLLRPPYHGSSPCVVIGTSDQLLHACDRLRSLLNESGQEIPASVGPRHGSNGNGTEKSFHLNGLDLSLGDFMERKFHEFVRKIKLSGGKNLFQLLRREFEKPLITLTLKETQHNQVRAAELLGMNRNTLRKKIKEFKIPVKRS
jgi:DNA-binding protein Fis